MTIGLCVALRQSVVQQPIHVPEVIEPDEKLPSDLVALRRFANLMDEAFLIPGTSRRVGLDALLGLIPGVGDVIGGVMSAAVIIGAVRHRVPFLVVLRMIVNVLGDLVIGAVPLVGDVADFFFEQNVINMRLLMKHRDRRRPPRSTLRLVFFAIALVIVILSLATALTVSFMMLITWMMRS